MALSNIQYLADEIREAITKLREAKRVVENQWYELETSLDFEMFSVSDRPVLAILMVYIVDINAII